MRTLTLKNLILPSTLIMGVIDANAQSAIYVDALYADAVITNVNCYGDDNGTIDLNFSGGSAPYTFAWSNGATTEDLAGLAGGNYSVTITDGTGQNFTRSFAVEAPVDALSVSYTIDPISSMGAGDGAIDVTVSGGTPFKWTDVDYLVQWSDGYLGRSISGLSAGIYDLLVTDANGCTFSTSITVNAPLPVISFNPNDIISQVLNDENPDGIVLSPNPSNGDVSLRSGDLKIVDVTIVPMNGVGAVQTLQKTDAPQMDFNLQKGDYVVRVTFENGTSESKILKVY